MFLCDSPLARDWAPTNESSPELISLDSLRVVHWKCHKCGFQWANRMKNRFRGRRECPACEGFATRYPELLGDWDPEKNKADPITIRPHSSVKIFWKCAACRYEWSASLHNRTSHATGCPKCAGRIATDERNFAKSYPDLLSEWDFDRNELLPTNLTPKSSSHNLFWICGTCKSSWQATILNRVNGGTGCPVCTPSGYRASIPGHFYIQKVLVANNAFLKFGITNRHPIVRCKEQYATISHRAYAQVVKSFFWKDGTIPRIVESRVKNNFGTLCGHGREYLGKYDGSTETLPMRCFEEIVAIANEFVEKDLI